MHVDAPTPSRLGIYYDCRVIDGSVWEDAGTYLRTVMKVLATVGCYDERSWKYSDGPLKFRRNPGARYHRAALQHKALKYAQVQQSEAGIKNALLAGYPIIFGFSVYESFERMTNSGIMPMPQDGERLLGGHAVVIVGWKTDHWGVWYRIRNSWGADWGDGGYFWMPQQFLLSQNCDDFWTMTETL